MPGEANSQNAGTQKALHAAQMLFEQGNPTAAAPIFANILSQVAPDSSEAALCLSNLTDIYEVRGDLRSALDYSIKLVHHPSQRKSADLFEASAWRTAEMAEALGEKAEADRLKEEIERFKAGDPELMYGVPDQAEDPDWLVHALKNAAYRGLERVHRHKSDRKNNHDEVLLGSGKDLSRLDQSQAKEEWHNTTSDMLSRLDEHLAAAGDLSAFKPSPKPERAAPSPKSEPQEISTPETTQTRSPVRIADAESEEKETEPQNETQNEGDDPPSSSAREALSNVGSTKARVTNPTKEETKVSRGAEVTKASHLRSVEPSTPPVPGLLDRLHHLLAGISFFKQEAAYEGQPQDLEAEKSTPQLSSTLPIAVAVVLLVVAAWTFIPRSGSPLHEYAVTNHQFKNANQNKLASLLSPTECELKSGQQDVHSRLTFYFGDLRDMLTIMFGQPHTHTYFLRRDGTNLIDPDGTMLYVADGPEIQLSERCQLMEQDVDSYFNAHKSYPSKVEELEDVDWSYENPFTQAKEREKPEITTLTFGNHESDQEVDDERADFFTKVGGDNFWNIQHSMRPGQIRCFNAVFKSSRGNINLFVIGAADSQGKVLQDNGSRTAFCLVSEDGKEKKVETAAISSDISTWIGVTPLSRNNESILEHGAPVVLAVLAIVALALALSSGKARKKQAVWYITMGTLAALAAFYFISKH